MVFSRAQALLSLTAAALVAASFCAAQQPARLTFDIASIHLTRPGETNGFIKALPGGQEYVSQNIPVKLMISLMYKIPQRQISGAPGWLTSDPYDIDAKATASYSIDDLHLMFQNLLSDRFNLRFHMETRPGNVYALTLDPGKPLIMKLNDSPQTYAIPLNFAANAFHGIRVPMPYLTWFLGQELQDDERPVIDQTGLTGNYDFTLSFAPVIPPGATVPPDDRPSLFEAVKDQLGLKLTPEKGPVPYLVIDHIDRPSEN